MLIEWRNEFETGIAEVDHEHRELVDLINTLHEKMGVGTDKETTIAFLGAGNMAGALIGASVGLVVPTLHQRKAVQLSASGSQVGFSGTF